MSKYKLFFLEGTLEYVLKELLEKFPDIQIEEELEESISFESNVNNIEDFRILLSPISVENESGNRIDLSKREWREEFVAAGINPSLAYIMCMIANLREQDILFDPFCGSSVLPVTALIYFDIKRVICSDISGSAIEKSKRNFKAAKIDASKYKIFRSDIKDIKLNKQNIDVIMSNLPFGIRVGNHEENISSYVALENVAQRLLRRKGKLVLLTQEKDLLRRVFIKESWNVKSLLRVNEGGLLPEVFVITKKG